MGTKRGQTSRLLKQIDRAWAAVLESFDGMSEAQLMEPGVMGTWSVKDVLAHVTTWEEEALRHLPVIAQGGTPPRYAAQGGIDAFNARMTEQKGGLPVADVLVQLHTTHRRLLDLIHGVSEDQLTSGSRFRHRLRLDTYSHYPGHAEAIREWRKRQRTLE
jgi:hypothetical protein